MTILAVDDSALRLHDIVRLLHDIFPDDTVIAESDALAAGKFGFNHSVDVIFAAAEMPRLDGCKLMEFIRHTNPDAMAFLLLESDGALYCGPWTEEADGLLYFPITTTKLQDALKKAQEKRAANSTKEPSTFQSL